MTPQRRTPGETAYADADALFVGRIMLLGGTWGDQAVDLLTDRALVAEIAALHDEDLITRHTVQVILNQHGYAQTGR